MKRLVLAAIAIVGIAGFGAAGPAKAQAFRPVLPGAQNPYGNPYGGGPAISPYLNLLQRGNPAVNYYGLVRPQQGVNSALNSLEQQVTASRVAQTAAENLSVPSTGHPIYFQNYQRFFLNTGAVAPFQNVGATVGASGASSSTGSRFTSNLSSGIANPSFRRY